MGSYTLLHPASHPKPETLKGGNGGLVKDPSGMTSGLQQGLAIDRGVSSRGKPKLYPENVLQSCIGPNIDSQSVPYYNRLV